MSQIELVSEETSLERVIERFWETVPPLWCQIRDHIRQSAAERFDITVEQFHILRHVRAGCGSISELAQVKRISRPAISQTVELLVAKGLLTRVQSAADRRFVQIELTDAGRALLEAVFEETSGWMRRRLGRLSRAELDQAARGMQILQAAFKSEP
ncbi:MAG: MarR family transcriptional regulator [Anaerolineae bacterium]|jgi:DNA-binding MarR family transcriptional regulator|nr:MarR family transcriptional regulator [Anaerolineae bacterium]MCZ7553525.1 MarR family transcriptional regulator [Anaerolineales bacterium]